MDYLNMDSKKVEGVVIELNTLLANYHLYYQNLRGFHWNILGQNFFDLHVKFEVLYTDAQLKIDEIAERILTLRYHPISLFSNYLKLASVKEVSPLISDVEMVKAILKDHKIVLQQMAQVVKKADEAGDEGTIDMIGSYIGQLQKASWMLDAWAMKSKEDLKILTTTNLLNN